MIPLLKLHGHEVRGCKNSHLFFRLSLLLSRDITINGLILRSSCI